MKNVNKSLTINRLDLIIAQSLSNHSYCHFQLANFMVLVTIIQAQTTGTPSTLKRPIETVKSKRGLFNYDDGLIGPPPPPPFRTLSYAPPQPATRTILTPSKWTNIFGFDEATYQHIYNELNGINYGIPTHITPPPPTVPSIFNNGYSYMNYGAHDYDTSYISQDGRILKQYSVHERHHNDHPDPRRFQPSIRMPTPTVPAQYPPYFVPSNINIAQPRALFASTPQLQNPNQKPTFLTHNHGPIALGSGSLGFIQLPNGDVFLGSGSLGYISHKDHYDNVIEITSRRQKPHARGPTTFGHSHL